jgi:hypothetical protein
MALTAIRCGAQNSVAIGGTADITGLEAAGGSIENDPKQTKSRVGLPKVPARGYLKRKLSIKHFTWISLHLREWH